jgi:hypothetical protein
LMADELPAFSKETLVEWANKPDCLSALWWIEAIRGKIRIMSFQELFAVEGSLVVAYLLTMAALAFGVVTVSVARLQLARWCFWGACLIFVGIGVMWGINTDYSALPRVLVVGFSGAIAAVGAVESGRFISHEQTISENPPPQTLSPQTSEQQQALIDALKGVGNFFYFALTDDKVVGVSPNGKLLYQWYTIAPKGIVRDLNYWVSPASANGTMGNPGYLDFDFNKPRLLTIHGGGPFASDRAYPEGEWLIQYDDSNGHWDEWFTVYRNDGQLRQHILVKNIKGETLHETKDDADFSNP